MEANELLAELEQLIKAGCPHLSSSITDAQYGGDNKSGELVIVTEGNQHQEFIISSKDVRELNPEDEEERLPVNNPDGQSYSDIARDGRFE